MSETQYCMPICIYTSCQIKNLKHIDLQRILGELPGVENKGASLQDAAIFLKKCNVHSRLTKLSEVDLLQSPNGTVCITLESKDPAHVVVKFIKDGDLIVVNGVKAKKITRHAASAEAKACMLVDCENNLGTLLTNEPIIWLLSAAIVILAAAFLLQRRMLFGRIGDGLSKCVSFCF